MFSSKDPPKRRVHNLSQFGLTDISDDFDHSLEIDSVDDDTKDSDLEAELASIAGGTNRPKSLSKPLVPANQLDQMISECLRDTDTDEEDEKTEENDSELLGELQNFLTEVIGEETEKDSLLESQLAEVESNAEKILPTTCLSTVTLIKERIELYTIAEANAKTAGEYAKISRFKRGLKTLNELLKQANLGKIVNTDDIPPLVNIKSRFTDSTQEVKNESPKIPIRQAPSPPKTNEIESKQDELIPTPMQSNTLIQQMRSRQEEYKTAALKSKRAGDTAMALEFLKIVKQFDVVVKMCEDGKDVDLSDMPPPPSEFKTFMENILARSEQQSSNVRTQSSLVSETKPDAETNNTSKNMVDALQERLNKYKSVEDSAKSEGNMSKVRRFGRIVKQYEDAIKAYKAGRTVAYDELPVPSGFGPLPIENTSALTLPKATSVPSSLETNSTSTSTPNVSITSPTQTPSTPSQHADLTTRLSGNQQKNNLAEKQMKILLDRQKEYKVAAIEAKKAGEINQAKEYLKIYKGFDSLLNAASSGLPVDLNTLPVPPSQKDNLEASFAIISTQECDPNEEISDIGVRIEEQLAKQLMMCKNTRDHHKAMGDIAGMNRFENLALTVQKDLDFVRYSKRNNCSLPKFHYEKRSFNIVHCNTDLTDNELEIIVVRGINYNVTNPKEVDTYVKIEFPLPNDDTFKAKTNLVKDTDNPDYDQHFKVEIIRGSRQFQRIFKRHGVKCEVYSRGGFLRSDTVIGTVNVKLQPLETKCEVHDTFDLVEGRKKIGGKLEIKLRVRNPIITTQMEHIDEKWLVIDT